MGRSEHLLRDIQRSDKRGFLASEWIYLLSQVYTEDECQALFEKVRDMPILDFEKLDRELSELVQHDDPVAFSNCVHNRQQSEDYDVNKMGFRFIPNCAYLGADQGSHKEFLDRWPSNRFILDIPAFQYMFNFWHLDRDPRYVHHVPSDLLFSGRVFLTDIEFSIIGLFDDYPDFSPVVRVQTLDLLSINADLNQMKPNLFDVMIGHPDGSISDTDIIPVGTISFPLNPDDTKGMVVNFGIQKGVDVVLLSESVVCYGMSREDASWHDDGYVFDNGSMIEVCTIFLQIWYSIQVFLGHPKLSEIFKPYVKNKDRRKKLSGESCVKIVRPLPLSYITVDKIKDVCLKYDLEKNVNLNYLVGGWETIDGSLLMVPGQWYEGLHRYPDWPMDWEHTRPLFGNLLEQMHKSEASEDEYQEVDVFDVFDKKDMDG